MIRTILSNYLQRATAARSAARFQGVGAGVPGIHLATAGEEEGVETPLGTAAPVEAAAGVAGESEAKSSLAASSVVSGPAATFLGACGDAQKAWHSTTLLAKVNPDRILQARTALVANDAATIVALMANMAGPTATVNVKDAFTSAAHRHLEMASIVARLLVGEFVRLRAPGETLDMLAVRGAMVEWIGTGAAPANSLDLTTVALEQISVFLGTQVPDAGAQDAVARARLALLSPFAISVETLRVVAGLSESFIEVLKRTHRNTAENQIAADAWMRAHPDFGNKDGSDEVDSSFAGRILGLKIKLSPVAAATQDAFERPASR